MSKARLAAIIEFNTIPTFKPIAFEVLVKKYNNYYIYGIKTQKSIFIIENFMIIDKSCPYEVTGIFSMNTCTIHVPKKNKAISS